MIALGPGVKRPHIIMTTLITVAGSTYYITDEQAKALQPVCRECGSLLPDKWKWQTCESCLIAQYQDKYTHVGTYEEGHMDFIDNEGYIHELSYGNGYHGHMEYHLCKNEVKTAAYHGFTVPDNKKLYRVSIYGDVSQKYIILAMGGYEEPIVFFLLEKNGGYKQITRRKRAAQELYRKAEQEVKAKSNWYSQYDIMKQLIININNL